MYYSVKTLLNLGKNVSQIARELKIDRKTVRKIKKKVERGEIETPTIKRRSILDPYKDEIMEYLKNGRDIPTILCLFHYTKSPFTFQLPWSCYNPVYTKLVHMIN